MKNFIWPIVVLIIGIGLLVEMRYDLTINSPIVARIDRITGDVWIANAGTWRKVQMPMPENGKNAAPASVETKSKSK